MGYEAKKRAIAGVLVSFLNKVARLMVRCQRRKGVLQSFPKSQNGKFRPPHEGSTNAPKHNPRISGGYMYGAITRSVDPPRSM